MKTKKLDLSLVCNHRLLYETAPTQSEKGGLDDIYILHSNLQWNPREIFNGIDFYFVFGRCDNVICQSQRLPVNFKAGKIHLISFAYWGDTSENITVFYTDGSEETVRVPFLEWSHPFNETKQQIVYGDNEITTIKEVPTSGAVIHKACFHHVACDLNSEKEIAAIELPDNLLLHIFAITFEKI